MRNLEIIVDKRCCNEKKVSIDEFQKKIQSELSQYKIKFAYDNSPSDAFCNHGYTRIDFINTSQEEQLNVTDIINNIFNEI